MAVVQTALAEYRVFEALGEGCGVFLWNPASADSAFRFREDWDQFAGEEAEVVEAIAGDLPTKLDEMGAPGFLSWIDEHLSNSFRILPPAQVLCANFDRTLQGLYRKHVHSTIRQFRTHLPLYPLEACAGGFGTDKETLSEEWVDVRIPGRRSLGKDLFLVRIKGRSMEPDIPNGSLCAFRWYQGGSRRGKIWLVERIGVSETGGEITVKRYERDVEQTESGWRHSKITMRPDNPEYAEWGLKEGEQYRTLAEFICVVEDPLL
jgi:hypothetical protein